MASGSEKLSERWVEGTNRQCALCGLVVKNLAKQVGEVRTVYPGRRRELICMDCKERQREQLIEETRAGLEARRPCS